MRRLVFKSHIFWYLQGHTIVLHFYTPKKACRQYIKDLYLFIFNRNILFSYVFSPFSEIFQIKSLPFYLIMFIRDYICNNNKLSMSSCKVIQSKSYYKDNMFIRRMQFLSNRRNFYFQSDYLNENFPLVFLSTTWTQH